MIAIGISLGADTHIKIENKMERKYFNADVLLRKVYTKIATWHNNDERLSDEELGRELKFLSKEIIEDVIFEVIGADGIKVDRSGLTDFEAEMDAIKKDLEIS